MKRYLIRTQAYAVGYQTIRVDAENEAAAMDGFYSGSGEIYADDLEVSIDYRGTPRLVGTTDTDDYGDFPPPKEQP